MTEIQTAPATAPVSSSLPPVDAPARVEGVALPSVEALMDDAAEVPDQSEGSLEPSSSRLPRLTVPDNVLLKAAAQNVVDWKERMDRLLAAGGVAELLPRSWLGSGKGMDMGGFIHGVLPFLPTATQGEAAASRLPLRHVIGDASRWTAADVAEPRALAWYLGSDDRAAAGGRDPAQAMLVPQLGLAWMSEGRSRVGFLRAMGFETLPARVTTVAYPAAGQLALYTATVDGLPQVWCVLDRRRLRQLPAPWLTVPLLTAYGVPAPVAWPAAYPPAAEVNAALGVARTGRGTPEVDLGKLAQRVAQDIAGEEWVSANLMQVRTWMPRWQFFMATFIALPAVVVVAAALALPDVIEAAAVSAALGFAGGAIGALAAPWVHARRKHLG